MPWQSNGSYLQGQRSPVSCAKSLSIVMLCYAIVCYTHNRVIGCGQASLPALSSHQTCCCSAAAAPKGEPFSPSCVVLRKPPQCNTMGCRPIHTLLREAGRRAGTHAQHTHTHPTHHPDSPLSPPFLVLSLLFISTELYVGCCRAGGWGSVFISALVPTL